MEYYFKGLLIVIRNIVAIPEPVLYRKAVKIKNVDANVQKLADDMVETLRSTTGVGLAAPQIGVSQRLIVVEFGGETDDEDVELYVVVNPEIVEASDEMVAGVEGCLSVPDMIGEVFRHEKITVKGLTVKGKPFKLKAEGWLARIFQHEIDHLNGIIYTDRAEKIWRPEKGEVIDDV